MKTYIVYFIATISVFSFNSFGQSIKNSAIITAENVVLKENNIISKDNLIIVAYSVEETINMTFGRRVTKYEVSKLSMVNTYDLGPNNTRVVTPIYGNPKVKMVEAGLESKIVVDTTITTIKPVKIEVIAPTEAPKYLTIDVVNTYAKVLDKGYKSVNMLIKVADRAYFDGDFVMATKYYEELFGINTNLDAMYYYRYAQSLKGINKAEKADEMMKLFESKNLAYRVVKE